jgi:hypothetical protein
VGIQENFTMSDKKAKTLSVAMINGSFGARMVAYSYLYIILTLLVFLALVALSAGGAKTSVNESPSYFSDFFKISFLLLSTSLPFIIKEKLTRARRRKEGLPIYESIDKILKQRAIDERVAMEAKAFGKVDNNDSNKDLNYWHDLLSKGAITQDEYNVKKAEFLK